MADHLDDELADVLVVGAGPVGLTTAILLYASANRDERYWERADEFDIRRPDVGAQLGLGFGVHNCAGQGLARIETQSILTALVERVDKIVLGEPVRGLNNLINCFTSLPVTVSRA